LLFSHLINDYKYIYSSIKSGNSVLRNFTKLLLQKLEISNLKNALRLWFTKNFSDEKYILKKEICYPIDYDSILNASNFEEILNSLKKTPYYKYITDATDQKNLYPIELSIDRGFFKDLFAQIKALDSNDRQIIKKFIGFEVDVQNLLLLLRYKNYYKLDFNSALSNLIPFGKNFNESFLRDVYSNDDINIGLSEFIKNTPQYLINEISDKINKEVNLKNKMVLIEDLLSQAILSEVYNILGKYPFSIGIVIAYFILKEIEIKNLISIVNTKYYELKE